MFQKCIELRLLKMQWNSFQKNCYRFESISSDSHEIMKNLSDFRAV